MQDPSQNTIPSDHLLNLNDGLTAGSKEQLAETNRRLAVVEQRLRLALESGKLGSWDLDLDTQQYIEISDQWKQNFGRPDVTGLTREEFISFLHPDDREKSYAAQEYAIEDHHEYHCQYRVIWPDSSVHWMEANGKVLFDSANNSRRLIGVTQEITERKQAEEQKERDLEDALARADRDPLTGLLNHRAFYRRLDEEAARAQRDGTAFAAVMLDLDNFKFFNNAYSHAVGDIVLKTVAERLTALCRPYDTLARFGGDEFALLLPVRADGGDAETAAAVLVTRLQTSLGGLSFQPDGEASAIPLSVTLGTAQFPREAPDRTRLIALADERLRRSKDGSETESPADRVRRSLARTVEGFSLLDALVTAVNNKDRYTARHSEDVMECGLLIARKLQISEAGQNTIALAALLHDVGKIGVPDAILRKPGRLTDTEFDAVKQHPQMGAIMVSSVAGLEETLPAIRHHHERWDGGGYPSGLRGEEIPQIARLMAVADAFSAMTTDRPYRQGMSRDKALSILRDGAGIQWDPECITAFLDAQ